jgi:hypothetical protein
VRGHGGLKMPTDFVAQNGGTLDQNTQMEATSCPKAKKARSSNDDGQRSERTPMKRVPPLEGNRPAVASLCWRSALWRCMPHVSRHCGHRGLNVLISGLRPVQSYDRESYTRLEAVLTDHR